MPDRRRRTAFRHPLPERTSLLLRERQSPTGSSSSSDPSDSSDSSNKKDDNPFTAPPESRPDQPWRPRHPSHGANGSGDDGSNGNGEGSPEGGSSDDRPVWGSQWSSHQPGRQSGGFGGRPGGQGGPNGPGGQGGGPEGGPGGLRWDPTDPAQRRARYALLSGMWAFFFAIFDFPEIALLLGALAVYWSISSLRAKPRTATASESADGAAGAGSGSGSGSAPAGGQAPGAGTGAPYAQGQGRPQTTAAVSGLVTALLALSIVAMTFTVQLVYRDYYTCVNDALTKSGQLACNDLLPKPLEPFFGVKN